MKRAKFFKVIGAAVVLPSLAVKALEELPEDLVVVNTPKGKRWCHYEEERVRKEFENRLIQYPKTPRESYDGNKPNFCLIDEAAHWPNPELQKHQYFCNIIEQKTLFTK